MPTDFEQNRARYAAERAIVFDSIEQFTVWALLVLRNYRQLAFHYLPLGEARPSEEKIVGILRARTRSFQCEERAVVPLADTP